MSEVQVLCCPCVWAMRADGHGGEVHALLIVDRCGLLIVQGSFTADFQVVHHAIH
jgi:hypothetical protein